MALVNHAHVMPFFSSLSPPTTYHLRCRVDQRQSSHSHLSVVLFMRDAGAAAGAVAAAGVNDLAAAAATAAGRCK